MCRPTKEKDSRKVDLRIGVYTDYAYHQLDGTLYAQRAFAIFLNELANHFRQLTLIGRLDPEPGRARYRLSSQIGFVPLPFYGRLNHLGAVAKAAGRAILSFWRALDDLDAVWLLGPHPFAFIFFVLATLRGRKVVLGVRQDSVSYMRSRHPGKRAYLMIARLMEWGFIQLGRIAPVVAVGPDIASRYGRSARAVLPIAVSLVKAEDLRDPDEALGRRDYSGEIRVLSVGRLDSEKNPLLLIEILARLRSEDPRWHLEICGEGDLEADMRRRAEELGLEEAVTFHGYLPIDGGLAEAYDRAHLLLHVSWTEGLPQILLEAFAHCLPVVATDVGGIRESFQGLLRLVPAGEVEAPVEELRLLLSDAGRREEIVRLASEHMRNLTIEAETARIASFVAAEFGR